MPGKVSKLQESGCGDAEDKLQEGASFVRCKHLSRSHGTTQLEITAQETLIASNPKIQESDGTVRS